MSESTLYRPEYHFTPPENWMNDPNGLVFYESEWHLFYQYSPSRAPGSHWGHAVSTDLVHWERLPVALMPDDLGIIASGSAVVDWNDTSGFFDGKSGLVAIYTSWKDLGQGNSDQSQSIAYSSDRGRTWTKYKGNPVLPNQGIPDFRDPKVFWHAPTERWVMIVATSDRATLYVSPNLRDWTYASSFGQGQGAFGDGVWECVDLFLLPVDGDTARPPDPQFWGSKTGKESPEAANTGSISGDLRPPMSDGDATRLKWVLNVSLGSGTMQYFVGDFDGKAFHIDNPPDVILRSTCGPDDYAAVTWSDIPRADGRQVWIGWMAAWRYAERVPTAGWKGVLTLPRRLGLRAQSEGVRLHQTPVVELEGLRGPGQVWEEVSLTPVGPFVLPQKTDAFEIIAHFDCGEADEVGIRLRKGETEESVIGCTPADRTVFIDRSRSGITDFDPKFGQVARLPISGDCRQVRLHLFVDRCSVEVFVNDGGAYAAALIFPSPESQGIEVYAAGGAAHLLSLHVYPLEIKGEVNAGSSQ